MSAYLQPWIMARLFAAVVASSLLLYGLRTALRIDKAWRLGASSEGQLALEKRAELVATLVSVGLLATVGGFVVMLLGADRQAHVISGAMCAYGVFESTGSGFLSLALAGLASLLCAMWLVVHRFDLRFEKPVLTRTKFRALHVLAPLLVADTVVFARFASQLDLGANATCCSASLGEADSVVSGLSLNIGASWSFGLFALCAACAIVALALTARGTAKMALPGGLLSLAALGTGIVATLLYVAPHVYETPHHTCPFCLLHGGYAPYGWTLLASFFMATLGGFSAALVWWIGRGQEGDETTSVMGAMARRGAWMWALSLGLSAAPIIRYMVMTGATLR